MGIIGYVVSDYTVASIKRPIKVAYCGFDANIEVLDINVLDYYVVSILQENTGGVAVSVQSIPYPLRTISSHNTTIVS